MIPARILVCDDEYLMRLWLEEHLEGAGYRVQSVENGGELLESLVRDPVDLVLLDLRLPDGSGIDFLHEIKSHDSKLPVIMMSGFGEVEVAVEAVRAGAHHFLQKPIEIAELLLLIEQALQARELHGELERHREEHRWHFSDVTLVGRSHAIRAIAELIAHLGERGTPTNVLVRGESGTGKEVVARAIHARGPRQTGPFIVVNCTSLPDALIESELFGHAKGAFTDAREEKRGLIELADGGTILLDEIGDMPLSGQAKILQFLETHTLRRVGDVRDRRVDTHVIAATNRDLEEAVRVGAFREDLYYRLNVLPIVVPPLRNRAEDIAPLAIHFIDSLTAEMRLSSRTLEPEALQAMERYSWPGNARQLRNIIERILLLEDDETISLSHLPAEIRGDGERDPGVVLPPSGLALEELERGLIVQALERTRGNKAAAARLLKVSRDTMRYRIEKYGLV